MSEAILELFGVVSSWLLLLLIPLYFWSRLVHKSLNSKDTHPESFERTVGWLRENSFGQLYLQFLGWLLDGVSRLIRDSHKFKQIDARSVHHRSFIRSAFGFSPFTSESHDWALLFAGAYSSVFYLLILLLGSDSLYAFLYRFDSNTFGISLMMLVAPFGIGIAFITLVDLGKRVGFKAIHSYLVMYGVYILWCALVLYLTNGDHHVAAVLYIFLFWIPLVNAPLDWLSLGVTRGLLQAMRSGHHKGLGALGFAAVDLLLALVFLFLITAMLVGVTALGNAVAGKTLVDIHGILSGIKGNPTSVDHWWIYFMLLSTLVPTLIHFALAGGAATLWLPRKWRLQIADGLERDVHKTFAAWAYLTFTPVIGFIVVPGLLLYCLWWLVTTHDAWLGMHLLNWAQMLADFANPQP